MFTLYHNFRLLLLMNLLISTFNPATYAEFEQEKIKGSVVNISGDHRNGFHLQRNGERFKIKGVGGETNLELLADLGGNSIRTWGIKENTEEMLGSCPKSRYFRYAWPMGRTRATWI